MKVSKESKYRDKNEQYERIAFLKKQYGNQVEITPHDYATDSGYVYSHLARFRLYTNEEKELLFKARRYAVENLGSKHYPLLPGQDEDGYGSRIEIGVMVFIPLFGGDRKVYVVQWSNAGSMYVEHEDNVYFVNDGNLEFNNGDKK
jgi:hypothetical protein